MTTYDVHIYREMRILYRNIEADTPEAAAEACRDLPSRQGFDPVDCDGQTFAAVVDIAGDPHCDGKDILFEEGQLRRAAPAQAVILDLAQSGLMTLGDGEAEFDDVMYWFDGGQSDWPVKLVEAIGWAKARAAIDGTAETDESPTSAATELLEEAKELLRNARYADGQAIVLTQDCEALEAAIAKAATVE